MKFNFKDGHSNHHELEYSGDFLDIFIDEFSAFAGDSGFFLIPNIQEKIANATLIFFQNVLIAKQSFLPI